MDDSIWERIAQTDAAIRHSLGYSEQGRPQYAVRFGKGPLNVSLLAGSHSDEPAGPEFLRRLLDGYLSDPDHKAFQALREAFTFHIIPHINPDGEAINWKWVKQWPDLRSYVQDAFREPPGRDLEFGYPDMRVENRLVSSYLRENGPFHLHMSLHGMAFAEGIMLLIERHWIEKTEELRTRFRQLAGEFELSLHDHDRGGEKGFQYIGPGFNTTPEGRAMKQHFEAQDDFETAAKFHLSSMEYIRSLGGNPLCLVTELPLFRISLKEKPENLTPGRPEAYLALKEKLPLLRKRRSEDRSFDDLLEPFNISPLPLSPALAIHLRTLEAALELVEKQNRS